MKNFSTLILILLLFACDDEKSKYWTEVTITAKNYMTGEPFSEINCGVVTSKDGFLLNTNTTILDQKPMENGVYHYAFKAEKKQDYWAEAAFDISKYYAIDFSNYLPLEIGQENSFEFEMVEPAYLKVDYLNTNCEDSNDKLIYRYFAKKNLSDPDYLFIFNWFEFPQTGCLNLEGVSYQKLPSFEYIIEWEVQRTSGTTYGSDTITVTDSTTYLLEY